MTKNPAGNLGGKDTLNRPKSPIRNAAQQRALDRISVMPVDGKPAYTETCPTCK